MRRRRRLKVFTVILVGLLAAGATWQAFASASDRSKYPPPGLLVEIDGGRLHLVVTGVEHDGPTILLEAGATSYSGQWHWFQQRLSESFRAVSYDRPGLGWSQPYDGPHDAASVATQLQSALHGAGIDGPYVVAAHSYGSFVARVFAADERNDVVALALIDATHPDQFGGQAIGAGVFGVAPTLARVGLLRVLNPARGATIGLPDEARDPAIAHFSSPEHLEAVAAEANVWHVSAQQAALAGTFGDLPLLVVSADSMTANLPRWPDHQRDLATLSADSEHIVLDPPVTHESLVTDRDTAYAIADAVADLARRATR